MQTWETYRIATGFEALMGYLYLSGQQSRLEELIIGAYNKWKVNSNMARNEYAPKKKSRNGNRPDRGRPERSEKRQRPARDTWNA